jgi:hypothetical protein
MNRNDRKRRPLLESTEKRFAPSTLTPGGGPPQEVRHDRNDHDRHDRDRNDNDRGDRDRGHDHDHNRHGGDNGRNGGGPGPG